MSEVTIQGIEETLCAEIARLLETEVSDVQPDLSLGELGLDSLGFVELSRFIQQHFNQSLPPDALYEHPTIRHTAEWLAAQGSTVSPEAETAPKADTGLDRDDVAIVGVAFRLPGASQWHELDAVLEGAPAFSPVPSSRWPHQSPQPFPASLKAGVLDDVARFDAPFFGISPREALAMDPQQRLLMECAWHAFEDAGLTPEQWQGSRTSVFVGASSFDYAELLQTTGAGRATHIGTGLSHAILANRLSQYFNVRGSSETLDTACSSSLVALWRAVRDLRSGDADMALVAGVNVFASATPFKAFSEAGMLSREGACLPFDEGAAGYVRGEGVVSVVLKPLGRVVEEGGTVLGVIRGGAVRHSGRTQSLTAPNPEAQADVIQAALDDAKLSADDIGYVEAHGTGTSLGDPIEIRGLKKVFDDPVGEAGSTPCHLSSIKSQIGHLEAAAGLAGMVKVLHCFRQRRLPGNPQLTRLNPLIELENSRLSIERSSADWTVSSTGSEGPGRRLAGISSFGFGGTNAHLILEEPPEAMVRQDAPVQRQVFGGQSFWPTVDTPAPDNTALDSVECQRVRWVERPLAAGQPASLQGAARVLTTGLRGIAVAEALAVQCPDLEWAVQSWTELAAKAVENCAVPDFWFDLSALDDEADLTSERALDRLALLIQTLGPSFKRGQALTLMQVTSQLRDLRDWGYPSRSLAGAAMSACYDSLASEYQHCVSKSVDVVDAEIDADRLARRLLDETRYAATDRSVAYIDQVRLVPEWEALVLPPEPTALMTGAVAVVTGGLGDIGRVLVADLVRRQVKAVLLTGRRALAEDAERALDQWRQQGVAVEYWQGSLTDAQTLYPALDRFGDQHGSITHLFHCAGAVDDQTVAFYRKTRSSMAPVFEPKVDALATLDEYFVGRPPQHVVLFSSISSAEPDKAVGVLDYAAANRYLDHYAAFKNQTGPTRYRSIQWDLWATTAMGGKALRQSPGQTGGLNTEAALSTLHRLLASDEPDATVCVRAPAQAEASASEAVQPTPQTRAPAGSSGASAEALLPQLRQMMAAQLEADESQLDDDAGFDDLGIDSIVLMDVIRAIEHWIGRTVDPEALIRCNSIAATAQYLADLGVACESPDQRDEARDQSTVAEPAAPYKPDGSPFKVAVVGLACQVPGAANPSEFWKNLEQGVDSVVPIPADQRHDRAVRWDDAPRWAGLIDGYDHLYPKLYGVSAEEAADVDPLVRLFTECSLSAIHNSDVGLDGAKGQRVGVFAGARASRYAERIEHPRKRSITGVGQNFIAAYVSHVLDLRGPNLVVDTACSSSLTAIHLACNSLKTGDCDLAVAGGVDVLLDQKTHEYLNSARALSPDGRCRPFGDGANGFVPGEGVGAVVLKPLDQALAAGDRIYAVVDGSATNNDGETLGITTPGADGQADVIRRALAASQVAPKDISYVEAHGTGTMIGDPIELQSLARAYQADPPEQCGVGSVKSNVGHLLSAAGVASFIKVVLALHHRTLPPTLHCETVNPRIGFERLPFYPVQRPTPWPAGPAGRKAGISAFGFGKTNVHLIVSERPDGAPAPDLQSRPLPPALCGERIRAWHDVEPVSAPVKETASKRPLLAVENVVVEELS